MKLTASISGRLASKPFISGHEHDRVMFILVATKNDDGDSKRSHICGVRIHGESIDTVYRAFRRGHKIIVNADGPAYASIWKQTGLPIIVVQANWLQVLDMESPYVNKQVTYGDFAKDQAIIDQLEVEES